MPNLSANLSGYGDVNAVTVTTTGSVTVGDDLAVTDAITATSVAATGAVSGSTLTGTGVISTTAAGSAGAPAIKCGASGVGIYHIGTNYLGLTDGVGVRLGITPSEIQMLNANIIQMSGQVNTGILSPAQITSNQTDYDPFTTNQYLYYNVRLTSDAARTINSLVNAVSGKEFCLWNTNTAAGRNITLLHDDGATGTAAMRFYCPNLVSAVIPPAGAATVWYDTTTARWRVKVHF